MSDFEKQLNLITTREKAKQFLDELPDGASAMIICSHKDPDNEEQAIRTLVRIGDVSPERALWLLETHKHSLLHYFEGGDED